MKTKFIHVGNHKCGSTFIQRKLMPLIQDATPVTYELNNDINTEITALILTPDVYYDRNSIESAIQDKTQNLGDICISYEGLSGFDGGYDDGSHIGHIPERLRRVFGPTKILIVLRDQKSLLFSHYCRQVRLGICGDFKSWLTARLPPDQRLNFLKYSPLVEGYYNSFGKDNVKVVFFKHLFKKETLTDFLEWAGLSSSCLDKLDLSQKVNPSATKPVVIVSRILNRFFPTKLSHGFWVGYDRDLKVYNLWRYTLAPRLTRFTSRLGYTSPTFNFKGLDTFLYEFCHDDNQRLANLLGLENLDAQGFV